MVLVVYNTLGRRKERFKPVRGGRKVYMYVCGPTVYDFIHIGNARALVAADVVRRYLEYKGYEVLHVSNITDVDDKTIRRAKELGLSLQQLGEIYSEAYFEDLERLNVKRPHINPRATQHINEMIELIQTLIDKGYAYEVDGDIYYDVSKFEDYGKLSGNKAEALKMGARIEVDPRKRNPADFALWKGRKGDEPAWLSPWGWGRPGWHIECSTMAMKYLGEYFDIHMGGKDLIFPHHENEIAQSEAATGKPFVKYWLHNEWVTVGGRKMAKSLGNFITVREALERYNPQVLRFFLVSAHYRSPIDFNEENLKHAERNLERILNAVERFSGLRERDKKTGKDEKLLHELERMKAKFEAAMDDDFNTPLAISAILEFMKVLNTYMEAEEEVDASTKEEVIGALSRVLDVLGIRVEIRRAERPELVDDLISLIVDVRQKLRERKDWEVADEIRDRLRELGVSLEDTPEGTVWRIESG
mgnify:CR=1 FL=1